MRRDGRWNCSTRDREAALGRPQLMQQAAATPAEKALQPAWVQPAPGHPNVH